MFSTDISAAALERARENARLNALDVTFTEGDLLARLRGPFDLIVSNPPYLPEADREVAQPEVRHDPDVALYGGPDGLAVARPLVREAYVALAPGGLLLLELDPRNVGVLANEMAAHGWLPRIHVDLTGQPRFLEAELSAGPATPV